MCHYQHASLALDRTHLLVSHLVIVDSDSAQFTIGRHLPYVIRWRLYLVDFSDNLFREAPEARKEYQ